VLDIAHAPAARDGPSRGAATGAEEEPPGPSRVLGVSARKRWIAESAAGAIAAGARQVVVLGAGFDTLGLRLLHAHPGLTVIEVDRAATLAAKAAALGRAGIAWPWPRLVALDLAGPGALGPALGEAGWTPGVPACFVLEAVLEYLAPREAAHLLAEASLAERDTGVPGLEGRLVALVPAFARAAWLADPARRPFLPVPAGAPSWFRLAGEPALARETG
jgi:methyltransferase (TIGR00027 family)